MHLVRDWIKVFHNAYFFFGNYPSVFESMVFFWFSEQVGVAGSSVAAFDAATGEILILGSYSTESLRSVIQIAAANEFARKVLICSFEEKSSGSIDHYPLLSLSFFCVCVGGGAVEDAFLISQLHILSQGELLVQGDAVISRDGRCSIFFGNVPLNISLDASSLVSPFAHIVSEAGVSRVWTGRTSSNITQPESG